MDKRDPFEAPRQRDYDLGQTEGSLLRAKAVAGEAWACSTVRAKPGSDTVPTSVSSGAARSSFWPAAAVLARVDGAEEHLDRRIAFRVRTVEVFNSIQTLSSYGRRLIIGQRWACPKIGESNARYLSAAPAKGN